MAALQLLAVLLAGSTVVCRASHASVLAVKVGEPGDEEAPVRRTNTLPDDSQLDKMFDIPAVAQKIVAARADAEPAADAQPLLGPIEIWCVEAKGL
jgi:hypothetical protein